MNMDQLGRINNFVGGELAPPVRLSVRFTAPAANEVLDKVRGVMRQVAVAQSGKWPSDDQWQQQLPEWFTESFAGHTLDEMLGNPMLWDFGSWLDAMKNPGWEWWSSEASACNGVVECSAYTMPYSIEPLFYLLRAAGAESVDLVEA